MSLVKAKCLKCEQIIEVENTEDAGICPNCGTAFVTQKVINNFMAQQPKATKNGGLPAGFKELQEKYDAFVKLYDVKNADIFNVYKKDKEIIESNKNTNELINEYNELVKNSQKWSKKYNSRVDSFNNNKYTAGADSWSEQLHRKFIDNAKDKFKNVENDIEKLKKKIESSKAETAKLAKEKENIINTVKKENIYYNQNAFAVTEAMCQKYPSNPLSYLYKANWYALEKAWRENFYNYVEHNVYDEDFVLYIKNDLNLQSYDSKYNAEIAKAEKFMTEQFRKDNAELIKKLITNKETKISNNNSSAVAQKSVSVATTKTSQNKKGSSSTKTKTSTSAKSGLLKETKPKKLKKSKFHIGVKIVEFIVGVGILALFAYGGYCLLKYGLKLF